MNTKVNFFSCLVFITGIFVFLFVHLWKLDLLPGLHYDEAWAANYAHRIAFEPGFWPFTAMSPYTSPWTHYVAATFFRIFGVNLFIFRLSQFSLVFIGMLFTVATLWKLKERKAALFLPIFLSCFPALVANHRFAIELNSFHVFCFGLLLYALVSKKIFFIILSSLLGITSHILFLAPVLGILGAFFLEKGEISKKIRFACSFGALLLLPFFLHIAFTIPKPGKAWALVILCFVTIIFLLLNLRFPEWLRKQQKYLCYLVIPFFFNLLFFMEGNWQVLITHGKITIPWFIGLFLIPMIFCLFFYLRDKKNKFPIFWENSFFLTVILLGLMMLKPAPRYFELGFYSLAILFLLFLLHVPSKKQKNILMGAFFSFGFISLAMNYGLAKNVVFHEKFSHFLFFKDSSEDFHSKQQLVKFLGEKGCSLSNIGTADSRVLEALHFLSHGDWPILSKKPCIGTLRVERLLFNVKPIAPPNFTSWGFGIWQETSHE